MIVKNEEVVIQRCLDSCIDYIDTYCICDTGSTDKTCRIIEKYFERESAKRRCDFNGKILHHTWKNFGYNRTLAVQAAKGMADFLLLMDADFVLCVKNPDFKRRELTHDGYLIKYEGQLDYRQPLFVKNGLDWKYIGVTHEYLYCKNMNASRFDDFTIKHVGDGSNKDAKFLRDIKLLEEDLLNNPDNMRSYFYLGQSHKDHAGMIKLKWESLKKKIEDEIKNVEKISETISKKYPKSDVNSREEGNNRLSPELVIERDKELHLLVKRHKIIDNLKHELDKLEKEYKRHFKAAIDAYHVRVQKQDFPEETYFALYMMGHCHYHLDSEPAIWCGYFLEAYSYRPSRLEALYNLIKHYRMNGKYQVAYDLGFRAAHQPYPSGDNLFIDSRTHQYLFKHEISVVCFYLGKFHEALELLREINSLPKGVVLPHHDKNVQNHLKLISAKTHEIDQIAAIKLPKIVFFTYNQLDTGGAELSFGNMLKYLQSTHKYWCKHVRDYHDIKYIKPDLIICQQHAIKKGSDLGKELGIPVIVTQHGSNQWGYARRQNHFIFNTYHVAKTETHKTNVTDYEVVWPYIEIERFSEIKADWEKRHYITFIGRVSLEKGVDIFLQICHSMPDQKFLLVGGNEQDVAEFLIKNSHSGSAHIPSNLIIQPFTRDVEKFYQVSKIVVFPSRNESFGRVAIEASLAQIPVVATGLTGIKEATNHLASYIEPELLNKIDLWTELIENVLDNYHHHVGIAQKISKHYKKTIGEQLTGFKHNVDRLIKNAHKTEVEENGPVKHHLFSITISAYNRPDLTIDAIKSVLEQTYHHWEVVIVDDLSSDDTYTKVIQFVNGLSAAKAQKFKILQNTQNYGTYYCRNRGVQHATGDYVINLDSDDLLLPRALQILNKHIVETHSLIVQYKFYRDKDGSQWDNWRDLDLMGKDVVGHKNSSWGHFCINRNYMVNHLGFYDTVRFGADTEMICRIKNFHKCSNLEKILYYARYNQPHSLTKVVNPEWSHLYIQAFIKWFGEKSSKYIPFDDASSGGSRPFPLPEVSMWLE